MLNEVKRVEPKPIMIGVHIRRETPEICVYQKKKKPCEDTLRRLPSANQGEALRETMATNVSIILDVQPQNCEKINFHGFSHSLFGNCYGSPRKLIHIPNLSSHCFSFLERVILIVGISISTIYHVLSTMY